MVEPPLPATFEERVRNFLVSLVGMTEHPQQLAQQRLQVSGSCLM